MPVAAVICLALIALTPPPGSSSQKTGAAVQDTAVERFGRNLFGWKSLRDPRLRVQVANSFLDLTQGVNRPSPETVRLFIDNLLAAVTDSRMTEEHAMRLAFDLHEVLHCAYLDEEGFEAVLKDAGKQLRAAGVARSETDHIVARLRGMGGEVRDAGRILDAPLE